MFYSMPAIQRELRHSSIGKRSNNARYKMPGLLPALPSQSDCTCEGVSDS